MEIYNITTKQADIIKDGDKIPTGWTDKKPLWVLCESFNGKEWIQNKEAESVLLADRDARNNLFQIDLNSIRSIREYISSKTDCPEILSCLSE